MRIPNTVLLIFLTGIYFSGNGQNKSKTYTIGSPDGKLQATVYTGKDLKWSIGYAGSIVILPSKLSMQLSDKTCLGINGKVKISKREMVDTAFFTPFYKKQKVSDKYNKLLLSFRQGYYLELRVYNRGAAYRFITERNLPDTVISETANFNFSNDDTTILPYACYPRVKGDYFQTSFESFYTWQRLSEMHEGEMAFLPSVINLNAGIKAIITEADLDNYPGMYLEKTGSGYGLTAVFAKYPAKEQPGGIAMFNSIVTSRQPYLTIVKGKHSFPWRIVIVSREDKELLDNDLVQMLAKPTPLKDISWIKPGKVSWDWWSNWNVSHVNFKSGINTQTYKYYIDFALANHIPYIIMDEGWSNPNDISKLNENVSVPELVKYGEQKNVGIILWATWRQVWVNPDSLFSKYEKMNIKGFKIDFIDRDDAEMTHSIYEIARKAAEHHLIVDFHGMYKPDGIQRTYPNVVNFEGVKGLENVKGGDIKNMPEYDVTIPFVRMVAGPMDYTPGAMRNATEHDWHPSNDLPESQGTRAHQVAMYIIYEAPLEMMADNPTAYYKEKETTQFLDSMPTSFDETKALDGKIGEYAVLARRKGEVWNIGAMTNWTKRSIKLDFSFLPKGNYNIEIFEDGMNADKDATDYNIIKKQITSADTINIQLASGGGWAARLVKIGD